MHIFLVVVLSLFLYWPLSAQPGCPDPQAINYNPAATSNDGSCTYPPTAYTPTLVAELPGTLQEISGLSAGGGRWWAHNDSGSDEVFFRITPAAGDIEQTITLDNAHNRDWEDMAADGQYLYIGDFGNNNNDRQNLGVYIVPYSVIGNGNSPTVAEFDWSFLPFSYIDQTDFSTQPEDSTVYDCEAMLVREGAVHLFTKSRRHYNTVHYRINPSNNAAEIVESFDSDGLITGAAISPDGKVVALVGYDLRPFIPTVFCWLLWDWPAGTDLFFSGNKRRIELGTALQTGQVESVGFYTNRNAYIANERTAFNGITLVDESLWSFETGGWIPESTGVEAVHPPDLQVYPNPFSAQIRLSFPGLGKPDVLRVKNQSGQILLTLKAPAENLDLGFLPAAAYVLELEIKGALYTARVLKQ
ncbi:MAG: hypothetical protein SFV22_12560 [Saprospiraceae bacterium]|nr:hypothetical protein [Saprospiraceae bacterium]